MDLELICGHHAVLNEHLFGSPAHHGYFVHPRHFNGINAKVLGDLSFHFIKTPTPKRKSLRDIWEMNGVKSFALYIVKCTKTHGLLRLGTRVFCGNYIPNNT